MNKSIHFDPHLKELLLVAGLSCSGKSTLINQLKSGALAQEITCALPKRAREWPVVTGKVPGRFKGFLNRSRSQPTGQIMHCDITGAYFPGAAMAVSRNYSKDDEVFCEQLASAATVHVVVVRTPRECLIGQVVTRSILLHVPPLIRARAARYVPQLVRLERILPASSANAAQGLSRRWRHRAEIRDAHSRLLARYAEAGDLKKIYDHWEDWLARKCADKKLFEVLYVEPQCQGVATGFRLIGRRKTTLNTMAGLSAAAKF